MASIATYKQFLAAPSSSLLADKATLHYVTTTTTLSGATEILKHLNSLQRQLKKKKQHVLGAIDGSNVISLDVDTELEFLTSGGPYLPGLDDNFLSDRTAYLPITHIVAFGPDGKIIQMRQQWDQGSLLKQLEIIGKTGRNWPIKDSREQLSMIRSCLESSGLASSAASQSHNDVVIRTRGMSANVLRDPHASLELFAPREQIEAAEPDSVVSPYAGNRPRQRGFTEILGDEPHGEDPHHSLRERSASPSKAGHGKNYQPMRIFDGQEHHEDDEDKNSGAKAKSYIRPNPRKYEHFDLAHASDTQDRAKAGTGPADRIKSKHDSQWSFDDFVTPQKPKPSKIYRHQDTRSWDNEPGYTNDVGRGAARGRRDAETRSELSGDGHSNFRQERPASKPRGAMHGEGSGLYSSSMNHDDEDASGPPRALGNITNLRDRTKDFDPHFALTDDSPSTQQQQHHAVPEGRMKAVKMMDANWSSYDQSPVSQKENQPRSSQAKDAARIHIAGDGMGTKRGSNRDFLQPGENEDKEGIHIAGDGMGGKKGTDRNWIFGGDEEAEAPKATMSRKGNGTAAAKTFGGF